MKYTTKSIIVGRKPRVEGREFKTAFVKLYECDKPIYSEDFPKEELDFENIEKVEFDVRLDYYLEGNDIVVENLVSVDLQIQGTTLVIKSE